MGQVKEHQLANYDTSESEHEHDDICFSIYGCPEIDDTEGYVPREVGLMVETKPGQGKAVSVWTLTPKGLKYFEAAEEFLAKLDAIDLALEQEKTDGEGDGVSQTLKDLRQNALMDSTLRMARDKRG
jgi:hypothetical protein